MMAITDFVKSALRRTRVGRSLLEFLAERLVAFRRSGFFYGRFVGYSDWVREQHARSVLPAPGNVTSLSIIIPVYEPEIEAFRSLCASILSQSHPAFDVVFVDDGSQAMAAAAWVESLNDPRFSWHAMSENQGIAAATNEAARRAQGEYLVFVDQDDVLAPDILSRLDHALAAHPQAGLIYTDEDKLDDQGRRSEPAFKPAFDRNLLYRRNYINHLTVVSRAHFDALGGLRQGFDGAQDYDLLLRFLDTYGPGGFLHLPEIGYHWRTGSWATGFSQSRSDLARKGRQLSLADHFTRMGLEAEISAGPVDSEIVWPVPPSTRVSILIPTRDKLAELSICLQRARAASAGVISEWIIIDNDSEDPETLAYLSEQETRDDTIVVRSPGVFNYSKLINAGARAASGDLLLLLNNDVFGNGETWISRLAGEVLLPWNGVAGAKLVYPDGRLQHAGIVLGLGGVAGHYMKGSPADEAGPSGLLGITHTVSAVTGACLMVERSTFERVGGLDEARFAVALNDVDFCLRVAQLGLDTVLRADVVLQHIEGASRGRETPDDARFRDEIRQFRDRWAGLIGADPYYNPNLSSEAERVTLNRQVSAADLRARQALTVSLTGLQGLDN